MNFKASAAAFAMAAAFAGSAEAQSLQPSISSAWDDMQLSQDECFARGRVTFERLRFSRIERVGNSVFADRGNFQFAFRCVADKRMYYVYGGGPGDQDKQLDEFISNLKAEFSRR
jgi:hypothetical protein